ncbi:hypothetical protein P3T27_005572 [Kitasatospora sp. MAA19]|uniref:peptidoglycan-binding domain-containing protein n=1 Tax=unclassified Kitasatospora TaxID=2633591 RepID=UPI002475A445|nr:hypothetical protein [Kitasatospora sp. MAA19]MDH6708826.1 hypothetical protein [Kitasatospora sp. MAA19]
MMRTKLGLKTALALATAGATLALAAPAQASTTADYIGDGYPNSYQSVLCVQQLLNTWASNGGIQGVSVKEDGLWGPRTKGLVTYFQQVQSQSNPSIVPDGIVGKNTGNSMVYSHTQPCYQFIPTYF